MAIANALTLFPLPPLFLSPRKIKKYYIDPSCNIKFDNEFESLVKEAMDYAQRAVNRLTLDSDTDFARVYETLFRVPKTNTQKFNWGKNFRTMNPHSAAVRMTTYKHVVGVLRDLATNWRKTHNRWEADVWFQCDAFTPHVLSAEGKNGVIRNLWGLDGIKGHFEVYNPDRVVIDLCKSTWEAFGKLPDSIRAAKNRLCLAHLKPLNPGEEAKDEAALGPVKEFKVDDIVQWSILGIIFREMMHCRYYCLHDANASGPIYTYLGWEAGCMDSTTLPPSYVHNAEIYAMLGVLARLADMRPAGEEAGGYTLSREDEGERANVTG
ncbi:hypothetical protein SMACR_01431 [Sordaria macrospora]|uniref:WGS project CABT00000000 data, contig 2.4 n=2 Tax=Sordaria macrospora TaxID=5147 RepID=F7VQT4_SORMK|nr:uncharacterized protein SMAC_01431 [Sordaria macrospora k-hell]KAA8633053.1 hypothetical protein SMACR_01431 [Sordaria macrospora]WPJ58690.1 hypothetical protein SMAC4_01431 [Sordaria macrospora]CCC07866.1 unnamed protein product [Sordaria macrospora k-hell]